jgi:hypothetical protein
MKSVVMLATVHEYQVLGNARNSELEKRLDFLISKFGAQNVMEEWSEKRGESFAKAFAGKKALATISAFHWANVGTPGEPEYCTYRGRINHPEYNGTLPDTDWSAPEMDEYGPFENQEARENRIAMNVQAEMENDESGLLILGLAHLHSIFGKLGSLGFKVTAFSWLGI